MPTLPDKLARWVADQSDLEFFVNDERMPLHTMGWTGGPAVYVTKRGSLLQRLTGDVSDAPVAVLGTYGLPIGERHAWLREALRSGDVYFFGDLDGVDLVTFASLVEGMPDPPRRYLGICDALLNAFSVSLESLDRCLIPTTADEREAIELLEGLGFPVRDVVGSGCYAVIESGHKIEIEGLLWEIPADDLLRSVARRTR